MAAFNWDSTAASNKELIQVYADSTQSRPDEVDDSLVFFYTKHKLTAYYEKEQKVSKLHRVNLTLSRFIITSCLVYSQNQLSGK